MGVFRGMLHSMVLRTVRSPAGHPASSTSTPAPYIDVLHWCVTWDVTHREEPRRTPRVQHQHPRAGAERAHRGALDLCEQRPHGDDGQGQGRR
eukprot:5193263-Pyramimonas_sp.AAC.1